MKIRKIKNEEADEILMWRNDSLTREMSINTKEITTLNHKKWFDEHQQNKRFYLLMAEENNIKISFIIFEISAELEEAEISINLSPVERGKKKSFKVIKEGILYFKKNNKLKINKLVAKIKYKNIPSKKSFIKNGFKLSSSKENIENYSLFI